MKKTEEDEKVVVGGGRKDDVNRFVNARCTCSLDMPKQALFAGQDIGLIL